jgi:arsenate reductase
MIKVFGIKNCDTMKKSIDLAGRKMASLIEFIDYKKAGVAEANLPDWMASVPVGKNCSIRRGLMWRKLSDDERCCGRRAKRP